jgi:hypothetical protein
MPLQRGEVRGYDFNRMTVEFTMLNQGKVILCSISTAAMDDLEGRRDVKSGQRVDQFMRLREVIEERASRKFFERQAKPTDLWCCDPTISFDSRFIRETAAALMNVAFWGKADMAQYSAGLLAAVHQRHCAWLMDFDLHCPHRAGPACVVHHR